MRKRVGIKLSLAIATSVALLAGCSSVRDQTLAEPSPGMMGPNSTNAEINNGMAYTTDTNLRLFWDDMGRMWLFDRPSHLTPYPIK